MSEATKGEKAPWYGKYGAEHNTSMAVLQYTLDHVFIERFGSTREAKRKTGACHISGCCNKRKFRLTSGGYIWEWDKK